MSCVVATNDSAVVPQGTCKVSKFVLVIICHRLSLCIQPVSVAVAAFAVGLLRLSSSGTSTRVRPFWFTLAIVSV